MRSVFISLCFVIPVYTMSQGSGNSWSELKEMNHISVDPRVELFSIICCLAEYSEYMSHPANAYCTEAEQWFSKYSNHPVVGFARELRKQTGIGYNAPMDLALQVNDIKNMTLRNPAYPVRNFADARWDHETAEKFLSLARDFAEKSDFSGFFRKHKALYTETEKRLTHLLASYPVTDWANKFFGNLAPNNCSILIGMQIESSNYSITVVLPDRRTEIYVILSVFETDQEGFPVFSERTASVIAHELSHSNVNPMMNINSDQLEAAAKKIFAHVSSDMYRMSYGRPMSMLPESLVRACEIMFTDEALKAGYTDNEIGSEMIQGFIWMNKLVELLRKYESDRAKYPSFDSFFPEIVRFFNEYAENIEREIAENEKTRKDTWAYLGPDPPKIISLRPANGDTNADPLQKSIIIVFDRPMKNGYAIIQYGPDANYPEIAGDCTFDSTMKIFTIPVKLKPGHYYLFGLNARNSMAFTGGNGVPLIPVVVKFKTRK